MAGIHTAVAAAGEEGSGKGEGLGYGGGGGGGLRYMGIRLEEEGGREGAWIVRGSIWRVGCGRRAGGENEIGNQGRAREE